MDLDFALEEKGDSLIGSKEEAVGLILIPLGTSNSHRTGCREGTKSDDVERLASHCTRVPDTIEHVPAVIDEVEIITSLTFEHFFPRIS